MVMPKLSGEGVTHGLAEHHRSGNGGRPPVLHRGLVPD